MIYSNRFDNFINNFIFLFLVYFFFLWIVFGIIVLMVFVSNVFLCVVIMRNGKMFRLVYNLFIFSLVIIDWLIGNLFNLYFIFEVILKGYKLF